MRLLTILIIVSALVSSSCRAQKAKVTKATEQQWSGGIAGRWGVRYKFTVRFTAIDEALLPDTIWVGKDAIALTTTNSPSSQANTVVTKTKKNIAWSISVGTTHDSQITSGGITTESSAPVYMGVALLQYRYKGRRRSLVVKNFTTHYPSLSYP